MFRPRPSCFWLLSLAAAALLPACKTMYSDVYSPRRNRYKPPVEKRADVLLPTETTTPTTTTATPAASVPAPSAPAPSAPTTPMIPGLEDVPAPPPPAE